MKNTTTEMFKSIVRIQNECIWVKPVCDFFNLDVRNQHKKIKNDPILSKLVEKNTPDSSDIDKNGRILLSKKGFVRWIQLINANTIAENLRSKFIRFQELIFDYLYESMEQVADITKSYKRLRKLRSLQSKIAHEISREKQRVKNYMDNRFLQLQLQLT
ncbi:MAG: phage antirepressor N-terminal domain-containing protein [Bacteroidota bacterium]